MGMIIIFNGYQGECMDGRKHFVFFLQKDETMMKSDSDNEGYLKPLFCSKRSLNWEALSSLWDLDGKGMKKERGITTANQE